MKIGIFGGSFNPIHKMHENIGKNLIEKDYVDKIIYVPTGVCYQYKNNLLPNNVRYDMLEIITNKNKDFSVSDFEFKDKAIYTCETLDYFKKEFPDDDIYFICGADNLSYIDKWERGDYILNSYKIIAVSRNTDNLSEIITSYEKYSPIIDVATIPPIDLSSTEIRKLIKENNYQDVEKYLDKDVLDYIVSKNLYK